MILTTGEIGLVAVGATLIGVFATQAVERKRYSTSQKERWFNDRKEVYTTFIHGISQLNNMSDDITSLLLAGKTDPLPDTKLKEWRDNSKIVNNALAAVRLVGSDKARRLAGEIVETLNTRTGYHPQFNRNDSPEEVDPGTISELSEKYEDARKKFYMAVREEFGVEEKSEEHGPMPDLAIVLAFRWVRKKMHESYMRAQSSIDD